MSVYDPVHSNFSLVCRKIRVLNKGTLIREIPLFTYTWAGLGLGLGLYYPVGEVPQNENEIAANTIRETRLRAL